MSLETRVDAAAAENMAEIEPPYGRQEATVEANRCLYCFDAPCIYSCPAGIDIPGFIRHIADGNLTGAARRILKANVLGASCARVCPTAVLCEGACVMQDRDRQSIGIGRLQRYAMDHVLENDIRVLQAAAQRSGKKVAVIGGGPAGLACAAELAQLGHEAVILEKKPLAGGLNTYGIACYKMTPQISLKEIELVRQLGVEIRENTEVGKDISVEELEASFDAIFLGVGLGRTSRLDIPGEDMEGVVEALKFIEDIHVKPLHEVALGRQVAVIGCGNTAIDAATQAKRLGAENVVIVYRRGEKDMPAYEYEYEMAKADGVSFLFHAAPLGVLGDASVSGLKLAPTATSEDGALSINEDGAFEQPFDMVIKALGQKAIKDMVSRLFPDLEFDDKGIIQRDFATGRTGIPHVFAGGDGANGGSEVVDAVAEGKRAARGIHKMFTGDAVEGPVQTTRLGAPGKPTGAGFDEPVRVPQLEAAYREERTGRSG